MSYAGEYGADEMCEHNQYHHNCTKCILEDQEKRGKRGPDGVLHSDNGAGYCVGHIEKDPRWPDGDGKCTVKARHCPVLNTPEQLKTHQMEDLGAAMDKATAGLIQARVAYDKAQAAVKALMNDVEKDKTDE